MKVETSQSYWMDEKGITHRGVLAPAGARIHNSDGYRFQGVQWLRDGKYVPEGMVAGRLKCGSPESAAEWSLMMKEPGKAPWDKLYSVYRNPDGSIGFIWMLHRKEYERRCNNGMCPPAYRAASELPEDAQAVIRTLDMVAPG